MFKDSDTEELSMYFYTDTWGEIHDQLESLAFKKSKTNYHMNNISSLIKKSSNKELMKDYYNAVVQPIYYEIESFMIATKSLMDISLQLINVIADLNIHEREVSTYSVSKHSNCPKIISNIIHKHLVSKDNKVKQFIFDYRNEFVHQKSIPQELPVTIDFFREEPAAYFQYKGESKNIDTFIIQSKHFLQSFLDDLTSSIMVYVVQTKKKLV